MPEEAVLDAPAAETEAIAPESEAAPAPEGSAEAQPQEAGEEQAPKEPEAAKEGDIYDSPDGKQIPAKFAGLFKQHPELRSMYFENRLAREHGGVRKLVEAAQAFEEIGGREAVQALEGEISTWNGLDELFSAGDPALAAHLFEADPEAAAKIAPAIIEHFAAQDPEGYSHVLGRAMLNTMQGMGIYPVLAELNRAAEADPKLKAIAEPLVKFWNAVFDAAQSGPERKVDPEREKLNAERQAFESEREKAFNAAVIADAKGHLEAAMAPALGKCFKAGGIDLAALKAKDPELWGAVIADCDARLTKAINGDPVFQRNKRSAQEARNGDALKKLYRAKIDAAMPKIAQATYDYFNRFAAFGKPGGAGAASAAATAKPAAGANTASRPGEVRLTKSPTAAGLKIDWHRTPPGFPDVQSAVLAHRCYVKGRQQLHVWQ